MFLFYLGIWLIICTSFGTLWKEKKFYSRNVIFGETNPSPIMLQPKEDKKQLVIHLLPRIRLLKEKMSRKLITDLMRGRAQRD